MMRKLPADTDTFCYINANPAQKRTSDCIMRAACAAGGITWDEAIDALSAIAHREKLAPQDPKAEALLFAQLGFAKQKQPRKANGKKLTGKEFCRMLSSDAAFGSECRIVAHIGTHHVTAILPDSQARFRICDTWDCSSRCIGSWWLGRVLK